MIENFRIRVFRAVARGLNFSRAAEELLLTQPAVTQQIKALEDEFGVPLFDRGGGHIALTAGGKALLPFPERMKELSDEAFAAVAEAIGQFAGELTLGASQTIGQYLLPTFVAGFPQDKPQGESYGSQRKYRSDAGGSPGARDSVGAHRRSGTAEGPPS